MGKIFTLDKHSKKLASSMATWP